MFSNLSESKRKILLKPNDKTIWKANWKTTVSKLKEKVSWMELVLNTGLPEEPFKNAYSLFSMNVHSSFLTTALSEAKTVDELREARYHCLIASSFLLAFTIDDLCSKFEQSKLFIKTLSNNEIEIIESFILTIRTKKMHFGTQIL